MNRIIFLRILLIAFAATLTACTSAEDSQNTATTKAFTADPIATVGHGAIIGPDGREIDPSPEFVINAQRFYIARLKTEATEAQRREIDAYARRFENMKIESTAERMLVNVTLLHSLVDIVKPQDAAGLLAKNAAMVDRFTGMRDGEPAVKNTQAGNIGKTVADALKREKPFSQAKATLAGGAAYIEECRKVGVPIPPDWGSPSWVSRGSLGTKFISTGIGAELFTFESKAPRGVCMALPRWDGKSTSLLGIICLGTETSKSCFWDNDHRAGVRIGMGESVPLSKFLGGADLNLPGQVGPGGMCTDCHAGENPFVVHPKEPMDLGAAITPNAWQQPIVHPAWPQNVGPTSVLNSIALGPGDGSCLTCHGTGGGRRFPEVSTQLPGYCGTILPKAFSLTMPPGSVGSAAYNKHFNALIDACKRPPSGGVVVNGGTQSEPVPGRSDTGGDLSTCTGGPDCPIGFCYWKTVHGSFWQETPSSIPIGDAKYRGSFLRIYVDGNKWKWRAFVDATGGPPRAPPGGVAECVAYKDVASVPDPNACYAKINQVFDPDGSILSQTTDATVTGADSANVLSGYIGNIAQSTIDKPDTLRVFESGGKILLSQNHAANPSPFKPGPMTGESWTNGCSGWTPTFDAKDVYSTGDVQLVPAAQADKVKCYVTGVDGAWSSTRNSGTVQPFAEIYKGSGGDMRLRVSPNSGQDRVGAYASCVRLN
jgi:hypothetical protein